MKNTIFVIIISLAIFSCNDNNNNNNDAEEDLIKEKLVDNEITTLRDSIEAVYNKDIFDNAGHLTFDLNLSFGGNERFNGQISQTPSCDVVEITYKDGEKAVFKNGDFYISNDSMNAKSSRFDVLTWSYFYMLPYKLNDEGVIWEKIGMKKMDGKEYRVSKMTFKPGTGDAPDDWYYVYIDPETMLINAAAYIVTYGSKNTAKAEEDPHVIIYNDFDNSAKLPYAKSWVFRTWKDFEFGDKLGEARVSNVKMKEIPLAPAVDNMIKINK
ncbi:hypothetical protein OO013_19855 [Mangrovivirga sp. M17]|uniref:Outer membrane lipoprotein-sorting protein n=1 Tax=Mangrovivirga halotolerans TaxID=2993936 RepID=A0ABT3RWK9_9BACT|nr:DUF6503 family protein [Mangrovivirga halotolerans]MCX2746144.1 hypothetical protein [Mangrovivirga halotolerans]